MNKFKLVVSVVFCLAIGAIAMSSCSNTDSKTSVGNSESFEDFYELFFSDSVYQASRTYFPLKIIQVMEGYDTVYRKQEDWGFMKQEYDVIKSRIDYTSKKKVILVYYGIDPPNYEGELALGLHEEYIFELKNGKWFLTRIVDSST